jgi:hypothetical protein
MKINPKYVLLFSDALIPILGYFLWNWSLYFILLFYFFDLLAQEALMHVKSRKIISAQNTPLKKYWPRYGIISFVLLALLFLLVHFVIFAIHPNIDFVKEFIAFWTYEELGVQQGYFLIPFVALAAYQQYKMSFLMRGRERTSAFNVVWSKHIQALLIAIGFSGLALGLAQFVVFPEVVYILSIVVGVASHTLVFGDE